MDFLLPKNFSRLVEDSPNLLTIFPSNFKTLFCTILSTFSTHTILAAAAGLELLTTRIRDKHLESTATANLFTNNQISWDWRKVNKFSAKMLKLAFYEMGILMAAMKGFRLVLLKQSHFVPLPTSSKFITLQLLWLEFLVQQLGLLLRIIKIKNKIST